MRVTQSMLSNNMLRNLSSSYGQMSKLQEQITSGRKFTRPTDDPVGTIKGMGYRTDLNKVTQFERNMNTVHSWLDSSDDALGQVGDALHRVKELIVQASNDTNTTEDRIKINAEIKQIREQLQDLGNSKVAGKYIFSGTKTHEPLFKGDVNDGMNDDVNENDVIIEVFDGITMNVNTKGKELFESIDSFLGKLGDLLDNGATAGELSGALGMVMDDGGNSIPALDRLYEDVLSSRADIGARQNRVEMMENRLSLHEINVTKQLSDNEDVDYAETITEMVTHESIHQAALSVGAKILQQTLVDFIR